jgi:Core-2/I-Branching enzyme
MSMKNHAYLILAHEDPKHLQRLIGALDAEWARFYVHIDAKSDIAAFAGVARHPRVAFVQDRVAVYWGGWSQVQATLNTLESAVTSGVAFSYYTLLSGSHFPLRSARDIHDDLEQGQAQHINLVKVPNPALNKGMDRFTCYFFEGWHRPKTLYRKAFGPLMRLIGRLPVRNPRKHLNGFELYAGSQWWSLSANAIEYIRKTVKTNPGLADFFRHVRIPDESFFQTILGNSPFLDCRKRGNVYTDWSDPKDAPCFIGDRHLPQLLHPSFELVDGYGAGPAVYARKFGSKNAGVVEEISFFIKEGLETACLEKAR